jgi:tetratricopeptide (TPR) repeat protein
VSIVTRHIDARFFIAKEKITRALLAMKKFIAEAETPADHVFEPEKLLATEDILEAFDAAGLVATRDAEGNVGSLAWRGGTLPYDTTTLYALLKSIGPQVKPLSFLEIEEEDMGCRISFDIGRVDYSHDDGQPLTAAKRRGKRAVESGDYEGAVSEARCALDIAPDDESAWQTLATALVHLKRWDEAMDAAEHLPKSSWTWSELAAIARSADAAEAALRIALRAAERSSEPFPRECAHIEAAEALLMLDRHEQAIQHARKANDRPQALYCECQALSTLGRLDEAIAVSKRMLKVKPQHRGTMLVRAEAHAALGQMSDARKWFEKYARTVDAVFSSEAERAASAWRWAAQSHVHLALGDVRRAQEEAQRALAIAPDGAYAQLRAGMAQLAAGRASEACAVLERAVAARPSWATAKYELARALMASSEEERARALLADATAVSPYLALLASRDPLPPSTVPIASAKARPKRAASTQRRRKSVGKKRPKQKQT